MADEDTVLIGHPHFHGRYLMMFGNQDGFSTERVALMGTADEHDGIADAKGEVAGDVHQRGNGEVGQGEECTALADVAPIEMGSGDDHDGNGMTAVGLDNLATGGSGKAVGAVE